MSPRLEVSESTWLGSFANLESPPVDYVVLDLGQGGPRPWLDAARASVELIGRVDGVASPLELERALDLDLDFLCVVGEQGELDSRRLPLRLIVEDPVERALGHAAHFGAAWARRICGWEGEDPDRLAGLARRERIFLGPTVILPEPRIVSAIAPFAIALPEGASAADLEAWNRS